MCVNYKQERRGTRKITVSTDVQKKKTKREIENGRNEEEMEKSALEIDAREKEEENLRPLSSPTSSTSPIL